MVMMTIRCVRAGTIFRTERVRIQTLCNACSAYASYFVYDLFSLLLLLGAWRFGPPTLFDRFEKYVNTLRINCEQSQFDFQNSQITRQNVISYKPLRGANFTQPPPPPSRHCPIDSETMSILILQISRKLIFRIRKSIFYFWRIFQVFFASPSDFVRSIFKTYFSNRSNNVGGGGARTSHAYRALLFVFF